MELPFWHPGGGHLSLVLSPGFGPFRCWFPVSGFGFGLSIFGVSLLFDPRPILFSGRPAGKRRPIREGTGSDGTNEC